MTIYIATHRPTDQTATATVCEPCAMDRLPHLVHEALR